MTCLSALSFKLGLPIIQLPFLQLGLGITFLLIGADDALVPYVYCICRVTAYVNQQRGHLMITHHSHKTTAAVHT